MANRSPEIGSSRQQAGAFTALGPRGLSAVEGNPFLLSTKDWIALQVGMANIQRTAPHLATLGSDLVRPAQQAAQLAGSWMGSTQDQALQLAKNIRDYGNQVKAQYPEIIAKLTELVDAGTRNQARSFICGILASLKKRAQVSGAQATSLVSAIGELDQTASALAPVFADLKTTYDKKLGEQGQHIQDLRKELAARQASLKAHNDEYNHYVVVAATTPTYAWVPFVGWIAAGTVAGVYGKKAADAKKAAEADAERISQICAEIDKDQADLSRLDEASNGLGSVSSNLQSIIPVVQGIEGEWHAIASDLDNVVQQVEDAQDEQQVEMLKLSFQSADDEWAQLAVEADGFLKNAAVAFQEALYFGAYKTQVRYAGHTYDEHHELVVDLDGATVNGVSVQNPHFTPTSLSWSNQPDATRANKPETASISFTSTGFSGWCQFPGEGPIDWFGRHI